MAKKQIFQVNGEDVAVWEEGTCRNPTVFLLHSLGTSAELWSPQMATLAGSHHLVAMDCRGHGKSTNRKGFSIEGCAEDAVAVLRLLGVGSAHIVGISMGGLIAAEMVGGDNRGIVCRSLTLACSYRHMFGPASGARVAHTQALLAVTPMADFAVSYLKDTLSVPVDQSLYEALQKAIGAMTPADYLQTLRCILSHDATRALLGASAVPTLVLSGQLDKRVTAEATSMLLEAVPHARSEVLSNAGHLANVEAPAEFSAALRSFWSGSVH